jgi:hypothetical protein
MSISTITVALNPGATEINRQAMRQRDDRLTNRGINKCKCRRFGAAKEPHHFGRVGALSYYDSGSTDK